MTGGRVVAVVGYSHRRQVELHPLCADRLRHAQQLAAGARAVILSGCLEAELMRAAWAGPDVPLICDAAARTTAGNAANVAARARELKADHLVVVTSGWHARRVRLLMRAALRGSGITISVETTNGPRPKLLLARELACLALLPVQIVRVI
ncbi:MAG: ElyC/SanA/YdcF family protein [Gaiellales bacterium]